MKILVLGAEGMLGNYVFKYLKDNKNFDVLFSGRPSMTVMGVDATWEYQDIYAAVFKRFELKAGDVIINCAGVINKLVMHTGIIDTVKINTIFPHNLQLLCQFNNLNLIHISTDCFTPNTKVLTNLGYVKISNLKIGDSVFTHKNRLRKINEVKSKEISDKILSIKVLGDDPINCTVTHPFYVVKHRPKNK
jgi:hypothetical protein